MLAQAKQMLVQVACARQSILSFSCPLVQHLPLVCLPNISVDMLVYGVCWRFGLANSDNAFHLLRVLCSGYVEPAVNIPHYELYTTGLFTIVFPENSRGAMTWGRRTFVYLVFMGMSVISDDQVHLMRR